MSTIQIKLKAGYFSGKTSTVFSLENEPSNKYKETNPF